MINKFIKLLSKNEPEAKNVKLPSSETAHFNLYFKKMKVGDLYCKDGVWVFKYSSEFIAQSDKFHPIVGFPDLLKEYRSKSLWPFFLIRIPGLEQPIIKETIKKETIDVTNEAQLLKRFGKKTTANPYLLKELKFK